VEIEIVVRGFVLGFAVAAPVGPIGILVIRRSIADGPLVGLATGLGAAVADALYATLAAIGAAAFAAVASGSIVFRVLGAAFLGWIAVTTLRAEPATMPPVVASMAPIGARRARGRAATYGIAFASSVGLTVVNPATIVSFAAAASAIGVQASRGGSIAAFSSGVFAGSSAWWLLLSSGAGVFRARLGSKSLRVVQVGAAALLFGFAAMALFRR
jgi:threonine/homoserine/homoserine lactone efflux protein